jgi:hypothetical protein
MGWWKLTIEEKEMLTKSVTSPKTFEIYDSIALEVINDNMWVEDWRWELLARDLSHCPYKVNKAMELFNEEIVKNRNDPAIVKDLLFIRDFFLIQDPNRWIRNREEIDEDMRKWYIQPAEIRIIGVIK